MAGLPRKKFSLFFISRRNQAIFLKNHPKSISKTTRKSDAPFRHVRSLFPTGDSRPFHFAPKFQSAGFQRKIAQNGMFSSDFLPFQAICCFSALSIGRIIQFPRCTEVNNSYFAEYHIDPRASNFAFFRERGAAGLQGTSPQRSDPAPGRHNIPPNLAGI